MTSGRKMEKLRAEAAAEMRRPAPDDDGAGPATKRQKRSEESETSARERLGRYTYAAIDDLRQGAKGFLVTCPHRREMSATTEAAALLQPYLPAGFRDLDAPRPTAPKGGAQPPAEASAVATPAAGTAATAPAPPSGNVASEAGASAQATAAPEATTTAVGTTASGDAAAPAGASAAAESAAAPSVGAPSVSTPSDPAASTSAAAEQASAAAAEAAPSLRLQLVKVNAISLVLLAVPPGVEVDTVHVVRQLMQDIDAGRIPRPKFCERIQPLETTCAMAMEPIRESAAKLAEQCLLRRTADSAAPPELRYAVGYRSRGFEVVVDVMAPSAPATAPTASAAELGGAAVTADAASQPAAAPVAPPAPLDRSAVINSVAKVVAGVFDGKAPIKVDLTTPQVAFLCEGLPVAGEYICGMCALTDEMFSAKPRLTVRSLGAVRK